MERYCCQWIWPGVHPLSNYWDVTTSYHGNLAGNHYYPLRILDDPLCDLDTALFALAQKLKLHYTFINIPKKLIQNIAISRHQSIELQQRAYHLQITTTYKVPASLLSSVTLMAEISSFSRLAVIIPLVIGHLYPYIKWISYLTPMGWFLRWQLHCRRILLTWLLASMECLVHSLKNNSLAEAGKVLRNHLLTDTAFILRLRKP